MLQGMLVSAARTVGTAAHIVVMLVIELVATMLVYTYLNLYHLSTFGYLVRLSRSVLAGHEQGEAATPRHAASVASPAPCSIC